MKRLQLECLAKSTAGRAGQLSRRMLCQHLLRAAALWPCLLLARGVHAASDELIDEESALARTLGYRHDAEQVDTTAFPKRAGEQGSRQFCDNCALFAGDSGDPEAPCSIFQNMRVKGKGWCNAWVARS